MLSGFSSRRLLVPLTGLLAACSQGGIAGGSAGTPGAPEVELGARLYGGNCIACHQESGRGIPGVYPSLAGSALVLGDPVTLARWVVHGERPASLPAGRYPTVMPQFGWMKPEAAAALLTYLRSSFGNSAPAVSAEQLRAALGDS